jgi:hypothetical protein
MPNELVEFAIEAVTEGMDAMAKVTVRIREAEADGNGNLRRIFMGRGADTDTVVAAARAYLFALNRLLAAHQAKGNRQAVAQEVKDSLKAMHAQYGTAHEGDFMGWGAMREEELK